MKIEQISNSDIRDIGEETESLEAKISDDSMSFLFDMMSKSLYSNPIGSIVREITSNCFDSHIEAGVDDAVVISYEKDDEGNFVAFKDVGVGLSPERVKNIYMNYFSSTKRLTNDQIGGFGLGSKTPFAYQDYFYITTIHNSIKYDYLFTKGQNNIPKLDLLYQEDTTERNGTIIKIYLKNTNDFYKFQSEIISQLCYFSNVYTVGFGISNEYRIFDNKYFKYRSLAQYSEEMHIILGKVSYPINWNELNMEPISIPVGVKFEIGELQVTPNREALRYTDESKPLLIEKINLAYNELLNLFRLQNKTYDNYFEWIKVKSTRPHISFNYTNDNGNDDVAVLYLNDIKDVSKRVNCSLFADEDLVQFIDKNDFLNNLYKPVGTIYSGKIQKHTYARITENHNKNYICNISQLNEAIAYHYKNCSFFRPSNARYSLNKIDFLSIDKKKYDYKTPIKPTFGDGICHFRLGLAVKYHKLVNEIRKQAIGVYPVFAGLTDEDIAEYKEYKIANNRNLQRKLEGKILVKSYTNQKQEYDWLVKDLYYFKGIVIYGFREDTTAIQKAKVFFKHFKQFYDRKNKYDGLNSKAIRIIQISQTNEKHFIMNPKAIHVKKLYSDNKYFRQLASSLKIEQYFADISLYSRIDVNKFIKNIFDINERVGDNLRKLHNYYLDINTRDEAWGFKRADIKDDILKVANQYNLFDSSIENIFKELEEWFKDVELILYTEINDETLPFILKLLREKKKKMNLEYYQKALIFEKVLLESGEPRNQLALELKIEEETQQTKFKLLVA